MPVSSILDSSRGVRAGSIVSARWSTPPRSADDPAGSLHRTSAVGEFCWIPALTSHRVSARLAQLTHGNSTFGSAANASLQFWHQTLVPLSPVHGCAAASLTLSAGAGITPCGGGTNPSKFATNYACEMWSAEGYSLLSSVTGNTSTSAM
jgi:hypothetical protein